VLEKLELIKNNAQEKLKSVNSIEEINQLRVKILGRKGDITQVLRSLKDLAPEERVKVGQVANEVKAYLEEKISLRTEEFRRQEMEKKLAMEQIDISLPGLPLPKGSKHPLTQITEEIRDIFVGMGCLMMATFLPALVNRLATYLVVWLLPLPVLTAVTATTLRLEGSIVVLVPISLKSAPQASTIDALCITYWCDTSL
jgi:hypothetical protein